MINAYNACLDKLHKDIKQPKLESLIDNYADPGPIAFAIYFDEDKEHKTLVFTTRHSKNYIEINGKKYWYTDMLDQWDHIQALIVQENIIKAIDALP